jgi:hypothetical protein
MYVVPMVVHSVVRIRSDERSETAQYDNSAELAGAKKLCSFVSSLILFVDITLCPISNIDDNVYSYILYIQAAVHTC